MAKAYYINTDLDLHCSEPFDELIPILEKRAMLLSYHQPADGEWMAVLEANESGRGRQSPVKDIEGLLEVIEAVSSEHQKAWQKLSKICFNIGWQSSDGQPHGLIELPPEILKRIAACGAVLAVTIYPSSMNDGWGDD